MNLQGNNTGENYYNSDIIHLNNYKNKNKIIILACNQFKFGYGLTSNIQIYDMNTFNVIRIEQKKIQNGDDEEGL